MHLPCNLDIISVIYSYRPQTKFVKVMFSQESVCPRGVHAHPLGMPPHPCPPRQAPPGHACPPPGHACPPPSADTTRCAHWAGGTHPNGMHSCWNVNTWIKRILTVILPNPTDGNSTYVFITFWSLINTTDCNMWVLFGSIFYLSFYLQIHTSQWSDMCHK